MSGVTKVTANHSTGIVEIECSQALNKLEIIEKQKIQDLKLINNIYIKSERNKSKMKKIILSIDGMTCSACSNGLEKYLNKQNGIINATVNLVMANATIDYDDNILNQEKSKNI